MLPIGLIATLWVEQSIKYMTTGSSFIPFKRPDGACDCDLFNDGGIVDHKSGFPSGHMASTAFYLTFIFLIYSRSKHNMNKYIQYHMISVLMGIARYQKKCHNILQISSGFLLGTFMAYLCYHSNNRVYHNIYHILSKPKKD